MTAVIRFAEASRAAWIIIRSSIRFRSTGLAAGLDDEEVGAADRLDVAAVGLAVRERLELDLAELEPSCSAILCASSAWERPAKTISRFCGVSGSAWPTVGVGAAASAPRARGATAQSFRFPPRPSLIVWRGRETDERVVAGRRP